MEVDNCHFWERLKSSSSVPCSSGKHDYSRGRDGREFLPIKISHDVNSSIFLVFLSNSPGISTSGELVVCVGGLGFLGSPCERDCYENVMKGVPL